MQVHNPQTDAAGASSRRDFLKLAACTGLALITPAPVQSAMQGRSNSKRELSFYHVRTRESLTIAYRDDSGYLGGALEDVSYLMRDRRTGEVKRIDPRLLDYLHDIKSILNPAEPFHIISGYRTVETNEYLRRAGKGAVPNSYHLEGKAVDLFMPRISPATLRRAAVKARAGGVGYYPDKHFIHLDVGPIRTWSA